MSFSDVVLKQILTQKGLVRIFWSVLRKGLLKINPNTECLTEIHGKKIRLPFSHELPIYLKNYPLYDSLIERLSDYLRTHDNQLIMIDVGANIGDSILASCPKATDKYLAIEPSAHFSNYLRQNLNNIDYVLEECFLTDSSQQKSYDLCESKGTAKLVENSQVINVQNQAYTLDELIANHQYFVKANFLKVDTDGFDLKVLGGGYSMLSTLPMVLFECDDFAQVDFLPKLLEQMAQFKTLGYEGYLVYDNFGVLMGQFDFSNADMQHFKNLLRFKLLGHNFYYFDILVYPNKYTDFVKNEYVFFDDRLKLGAR